VNNFFVVCSTESQLQDAINSQVISIDGLAANTGGTFTVNSNDIDCHVENVFNGTLYFHHHNEVVPTGEFTIIGYSSIPLIVICGKDTITFALVSASAS
jgi:hypothetical protein